MTADLVTRLRGWLDEDVPIGVIMNEAADRIEKLEAALRDIGKPPDHFTINDATATARAALGEERT